MLAILNGRHLSYAVQRIFHRNVETSLFGPEMLNDIDDSFCLPLYIDSDQLWIHVMNSPKMPTMLANQVRSFVMRDKCSPILLSVIVPKEKFERVAATTPRGTIMAA